MIGKLRYQYYLNMLLSMNRGHIKGLPSNAKPLYLLAVFNCIEDGVIMGNRIVYNNTLLSCYETICTLYEHSKPITPFYKPFFHTVNEPFYYILYKPNIGTPSNSRTPSAKFLRENVEYAALDDELWDMLQDKEVRNEFREAIVNHYIKNNKTK